ncbi:permease prefix domain 1-containing protein [Microbacterium sp. NPDC055357]
MNAMTLTDRYIDAAMRTVPEKQRADLAAELRASIDDQIDARLDEGLARDAAEHAVLTELGDPDKLAADYTDRPLFLIGPRYYLTWWRLLKFLWAIVPACAVVGTTLGMSLAQEPVGEIFGTAWAVLMGSIVHIAFWTTLVFFIVERAARGADVGFVGEWTLDRLPEPRERGATLSDLVASLVLLAVMAGAVLWDHFVGVVYFADGGGWVSFLAPDLWPVGIAVLLLLIALEALLAIAVYARGRWDTRLATINVVLNLAIVVPAVWLLLTDRLLNPEFFPTFVPDDGETVTTIIAVIFGFGIVGIAVWDAIDAFLKARRSR